MKPAAGGTPAGDSFRMKGGGPGTGVGGVCGRATSDVAQVPSQRSPPVCAIRTEGNVESRLATAAPAAINRLEELRASGNCANHSTLSFAAEVTRRTVDVGGAQHYSPAHGAANN
jgi:hypothetical protein